jgi:antitoxin HicB
MRFVYPARLRSYSADEIVVSFRDLPECLTSGADEAEALAEAADALEEAIAGRMNRVDCIPVPSRRRAGEHLVSVPPQTAAKAALALALRETGVSRVALAARLGTDEKAVRRMLDPRHRTSANRIHRALRALGHDLVVESRAA